MANNKPASKWTDVQLAIAAISMTSILAFWNMFAGLDKQKADEKAAAELEAQQAVPATVSLPPTPVPTMPPVGYTILFGGEAPQPQVIVVNNHGGGGGGGGGGAVTSTSSS